VQQIATSPGNGIAEVDQIGGSVLAVLVATGLLVYGALAWSGRVPAVHDTTGEDQSGTFLLWGALLFVFGLFLARQSRRWLVARRVERLSSDPAIAAQPAFEADVAARRAPAIPDLEVCFAGEPVQFRRAAPVRRAGAGRRWPTGHRTRGRARARCTSRSTPDGHRSRAV
jgi:LPXTG-motif cell wall-anchored protein